MTTQTGTLQLDHARLSARKVKVTARWTGEAVHIDTLDPSSATSRERFINALIEKQPQVDRQVVDAELLKIADAPALPPGPVGKREAPESQEADELLAKMPQKARDEATAILEDPLLIERVVDDVAALGVAGERETTATVYLIGVSRLLVRPLAGIVQGPSSSGKSYLIERTADLFPPEAVIHATQMTPQAFFHMRPGTLAHRFVVAGERSRVEDDERAEATRALREMLSAGRLTKLMPIKVNGTIETVQIEQEGPIAYVESTTLTRIFEEDANRCLLLHTDEQPEQTRRIIRSLAEAHCAAAAGDAVEKVVQRHHALQRLLKPVSVIIPFAQKLGEMFTGERVEARRAFPQLLTMIQSVALLHQRQRDRDAEGRLVATADDYGLARYLLLKPLARQLGGRISDPACRFHERLAKWAAMEFTTKEAKKRETNSRSSVYGWLAELHEGGVVEVVEEARGRSAARWKLTGLAPDTGVKSALPAVEEVCPEPTWKHGHKPEAFAPR
jgi:hypothetical protein